MIEWNEKYATGNEAIDKQHRYLFAFLNDYEQSVRVGTGKYYMDNTFHLLEHYAKAHFVFEEKCMVEHRCSFAQQNKCDHGFFVKRIEEFKSRLENGEEAQAFFEEIHLFLENWVKQHIIGIDTHLKECLRKS